MLARTRVTTAGWLVVKQQDVTIFMTCSRRTGMSLNKHAQGREAYFGGKTNSPEHVELACFCKSKEAQQKHEWIDSIT